MRLALISSMHSILGWLSALRFSIAGHVAYLVERHAALATATAHPARKHIHAQRSVGEWAADSITAAAGSWAFVLVHVVWFATWLVLRLDINLLTLIVSLEAIFLATFVLMSQNRSGARDRLRDDTEAYEVEQLYMINQQQLEILRRLPDMPATRTQDEPQPAVRAPARAVHSRLKRPIAPIDSSLPESPPPAGRSA